MRKILIIFLALFLAAFQFSCKKKEENSNDSYISAAEKGDVEAQYQMGMSYLTETSMEPEKAVRWLEKAANQGHKMAQYELGNYYNMTNNFDKAYESYLKSAEQGVAEAQNALGYMNFYGLGVPVDHKKAFEWYSKAAENGNIYAMHNIAEMYYMGDYVKQDYKKAAELYAKNGYAISHYNLGAMYLKGEGLEKDYDKAYEWFLKAAEQEHVMAQFALGYMYYNDFIADDTNHSNALKWFKKAADNGFVDAQFQLGLIYFDGESVNQDYKEAIKWFEMAAYNGDIEAQEYLGYMYNKGLGVPINNKTAILWYDKPAKMGIKTAQYGLGSAYLEENDVINGCAWIYISQSADTKECDKISGKQKEEVNKLVNEIIEKYGLMQ